jgi:hypothetical protein
MPIVFSRVVRIHLDDEWLHDKEGQDIHDRLEELFDITVRTEFDDLALHSIDPRLRLEIAE